MKEQLVNEVVQKTGLSNDQARVAVDAALGFLKQKLPEPLASGLGSMLGGADAGGDSGGDSGGGGVMGAISGLFK